MAIGGRDVLLYILNKLLLGLLRHSKFLVPCSVFLLNPRFFVQPFPPFGVLFPLNGSASSPLWGMGFTLFGHNPGIFFTTHLPGLLFTLILSCMKKTILFAILAAAGAGIVSCKKDKQQETQAQPTVITATGDINASINSFRDLLGNPLNTTPGQQSGRREINWDGVPAQFQAQSIPQDFFNPTNAGATASLQRGFVYDPNPGDGDFRVSTSGFGNIEPTLSSQLTSFSGDKVFANINENEWNALFRVAGSTQAGAIKGFGAVFIDVDLAQNSYLEFFSGSKSLGKFFVPVHDANSNFSFLGVAFPEKVVTSVRIGHGNGKLATAGKDISNGGTKDIVALDDFLYDEPKAQ